MAHTPRASFEMSHSFSMTDLETATRREYMKLHTVRSADLDRELKSLYAGTFRALAHHIFDERLLPAYGLPECWECVKPDNIPPLSDFRGANVLRGYRDYAIDGRIPAIDLVYDLDDLGTFVGQALALSYHSGEVETPICTLRVFDTTWARLKLDSGNDCPAVWEFDSGSGLTLFEVALLAGMSERSVRNATLASARDRLKTSAAGSRVLVSPPEALRWLRGRRGFVETNLEAE